MADFSWRLFSVASVNANVSPAFGSSSGLHVFKKIENVNISTRLSEHRVMESSPQRGAASQKDAGDDQQQRTPSSRHKVGKSAWGNDMGENVSFWRRRNSFLVSQKVPGP